MTIKLEDFLANNFVKLEEQAIAESRRFNSKKSEETQFFLELEAQPQNQLIAQMRPWAFVFFFCLIVKLLIEIPRRDTFFTLFTNE